jgi:cytosine/creatinine deaminase
MDKFMKAAFDEANKGLEEGGIPIGAVLVRGGKIIGRGHNRRVQEDDVTAHAEINCLKNAGRLERYQDCVLYSTLSPCYMCSGAAVLFKIPVVVVGESKNYMSGEDLLRAHGIEVRVLNDPGLIKFFSKWAKENPHLWKEDIGEL